MPGRSELTLIDGGTGRCNAISRAFRTDTETARSFIEDLISVP